MSKLVARIEEQLRNLNYVVAPCACVVKGEYLYELELRWARPYNAYFASVNEHIKTILMCFVRVGVSCEIATEYVFGYMFVAYPLIFACRINSKICDLILWADSRYLPLELDQSPCTDINLSDIGGDINYLCVGELPTDDLLLKCYYFGSSGVKHCYQQQCVVMRKCIDTNKQCNGKIYISRDPGSLSGPVHNK